MAELINCSVCQAICLKEHVSDICPSCYKKEEAVYQRVQRFLKRREHRTATNAQVVEKTGIELKLLYRFMKTGRLRIIGYPNLSYPCERCETMIRKGRLCETCMDKLTADLERFELEQAISNARTD